MSNISPDEAIENSDLVPRPNYVLHTSPEKFHIVWKVEDMTIEQAEPLNHAMVREFDGDPAPTDSTRVLRLPGFANKKYEADFYVQAHAESTQTYHLRDFKPQIDSPDAPRHQHEGVARKGQAELTNEAWNPATYGVYKSPSADREPDH